MDGYPDKKQIEKEKEKVINTVKIKWPKQKGISKEIEMMFPDNSEERRRIQRYVYNIIRMKGISKEKAITIMEKQALYP